MSGVPVGGQCGPAALLPVHLYGQHQVHPPGVPDPVAPIQPQGVLRTLQPPLLIHAQYVRRAAAASGNGRGGMGTWWSGNGMAGKGWDGQGLMRDFGKVGVV